MLIKSNNKIFKISIAMRKKFFTGTFRVLKDEWTFTMQLKWENVLSCFSEKLSPCPLSVILEKCHSFSVEDLNMLAVNLQLLLGSRKVIDFLYILCSIVSIPSQDQFLKIPFLNCLYCDYTYTDWWCVEVCII